MNRPEREYDIATLDPREIWLHIYNPAVEKASGQIAEQALAGSLGGLMLRDYRMSYYYSGSAYNQRVIFNLLGFEYHYAGQAVVDAIPEALAAIEDSRAWYGAARPPQAHQALHKGHYEEEAEAEWKKFTKIFGSQKGSILGHIATESSQELMLDHQDLLKHLQTNLIDGDLTYTGRGRPARYSHAARYMSFYREHVIYGRPTGTPAFNAIFARLQQIPWYYERSKLALLGRAWEAKFLGQQFVPADYNDPEYDYWHAVTGNLAEAPPQFGTELEHVSYRYLPMNNRGEPPPRLEYYESVKAPLPARKQIDA